MIKTLDEATERLARRSEFHAEAERRLDHMDRTGEYIEFEELQRFARALAAGDRNPPRPALSKKPPSSVRAAKVK